MDSLVFPSQEALEVALRGGLVPREVQRAAVRVGFRAGGVVELLPSVPVGPAALKALVDVGVLERAPSKELTARSCWAAALKPRPTDVSYQAPPRVLFTLPSRALLLELCGELFRLGCDRQEFRLVDSKTAPMAALVRVSQPPWYVLSRALEHAEPLRAFLPTPPGQEAVWTELGYTHPLLSALEPAPGATTLVTAEGDWLTVEDGEWTDVDKLVEPSQLPEVLAFEASPPPRLEVHLKLTRAARSEGPSLWVVKQGLAATDALVRATPEPALEGLLFAVVGDTVLLRVRPGREASAPALPGEPYVRLFELPNLYAPQGLSIEPPLRRERLRQWLAPDAELLTWLEPRGGGSFAKVTLAESAFRPLTEWVDYVIDGGEEQLDGWVKSAAFDFADFSARDDAVPQRSGEREEPLERGKPKRPKERSESRAGAFFVRHRPAPRAGAPRRGASGGDAAAALGAGGRAGAGGGRLSRAGGAHRLAGAPRGLGAPGRPLRRALAPARGGPLLLARGVGGRARGGPRARPAVGRAHPGRARRAAQGAQPLERADLGGGGAPLGRRALGRRAARLAPGAAGGLARQVRRGPRRAQPLAGAPRGVAVWRAATPWRWRARETGCWRG